MSGQNIVPLPVQTVTFNRILPDSSNQCFPCGFYVPCLTRLIMKMKIRVMFCCTMSSHFTFEIKAKEKNERQRKKTGRMRK